MPRESESKRHHSRFDRESSPKRSRRDGKPGMERSPHRPSPEVRHKDDDDDRKHRRRLQDPLPLEKPHPSDSKHNKRSSNTGHNSTSAGCGGRSGSGWGRNQEDERRGRHSDTTKKKFREEREEIKKEEGGAERDRRGNRGGRNEYYAGQANRARGGGVRQGQGYRGVVDKWKHDMFDEVNRSPPASQNEDNDPVAKVEALLAL